MNEDCGWEEVYKLNGVSSEYNKALDEFDIMIEDAETKLSKAGFEELDLNISKREAITV